MAAPSDKIESPSVVLDELAQTALDVVRKASKHKQSLGGDNFYGNKLAQLRADATNTFAEMSANSAGDTSAIAELIDVSFSSKTNKKDRLTAIRELSHALKTKWKQTSSSSANPGNELFPLAIIAKTRRGYLLTIAKQMNGSMREGWYDACSVMMRRLVEIVIIEAYEQCSIQDRVKDGSGNYFQLSA